jgi:hypothetical protein
VEGEKTGDGISYASHVKNPYPLKARATTFYDPGVRFSNVFVNLRIEYNACKNLRIATIFVILELHLIRVVTDCVCEILLQWRSVATMQNVQCC